MNIAQQNVPGRLLQLQNKQLTQPLKIIVLVCNPTKRSFSDFSLHKREPKLWLSHRIKNYLNFSQFIKEGIEILEKDDRKNNDTFIMNIKNRKATPNFNKYSILTSSQYVIHLKYYLKFFEKGQLVFVNGDKLAKNPGEIMEKLQNDLGVEKEIKKSDFVVNPETGFPCISKVNLERRIQVL